MESVIPYAKEKKKKNSFKIPMAVTTIRGVIKRLRDQIGNS